MGEGRELFHPSMDYRLEVQSEGDGCRISQIPLAVLSTPHEGFGTRALTLAGPSTLKGPEKLHHSLVYNSSRGLIFLKVIIIRGQRLESSLIIPTPLIKSGHY